MEDLDKKKNQPVEETETSDAELPVGDAKYDTKPRSTEETEEEKQSTKTCFFETNKKHWSRMTMYPLDMAKILKESAQPGFKDGDDDQKDQCCILC